MKPPAIHQEIDAAVVDRITQSGPGGVSSLALGSALVAKLGDRLPPAGKLNLNPLWNACEHANRACQRLRKAGRIRYESRAWRLV